MQELGSIRPLVQRYDCRLDAAAARRRLWAGTLVGCLAVGMYAVSFFLDAAERMAGYQAFLLALYIPVYWPMWAANPVFWFGLSRLCQGRYQSAGTAGLVALILALSESWLCGGLDVGYFLWAGSMAALALAGLCRELERQLDSRQRWAATLPLGEASRIASQFHGRPRPSQGRRAWLE
jgi:hypothetical protein